VNLRDRNIGTSDMKNLLESKKPLVTGRFFLAG